MRRAWLILLAGCYDSAKFCDVDCPPGDAGGDDATDGPTVDTPDVMPMPACVSKQFLDLPTAPLMADGATYTTDGVIAIYEDDDAATSPVRETAADEATVGEPLELTASTTFTLTRPRLAPDGLELFALGQDVISDAFSLVKMKRVQPKRWEPPVTVVITVPASLVDSDFVPGVPTGTNPRHMVVGRATSSALFEGVEQPAGKWTFTEMVPFPNVTNVRDPFLSKDGLALLFVATSGGTFQIHRATRTNIDTAFDLPEPLLNFTGAGGNERTPALSPDCEKLYWGMTAAPGTFTADD